MKDIKNFLVNEAKDETTVTLEPWADFVVIDTENGEISYHKESELKDNKSYFGEATENVLKLKPLQSFEDSINVYVRIK